MGIEFYSESDDTAFLSLIESKHYCTVCLYCLYIATDASLYPHFVFKFALLRLAGAKNLDDAPHDGAMTPMTILPRDSCQPLDMV